MPIFFVYTVSFPDPSIFNLIYIFDSKKQTMKWLHENQYVILMNIVLKFVNSEMLHSIYLSLFKILPNIQILYAQTEFI